MRGMVSRHALLALGLLISFSMATCSATEAETKPTINDKAPEPVKLDVLPKNPEGAAETDKKVDSKAAPPNVGTATTRIPNVLKIPSYLSQVCTAILALSSHLVSDFCRSQGEAVVKFLRSSRVHQQSIRVMYSC